MDRACASGAQGREFEPLRARHQLYKTACSSWRERRRPPKSTRILSPLQAGANFHQFPSATNVSADVQIRDPSEKSILSCFGYLASGTGSLINQNCEQPQTGIRGFGVRQNTTWTLVVAAICWCSRGSFCLRRRTPATTQRLRIRLLRSIRKDTQLAVAGRRLPNACRHDDLSHGARNLLQQRLAFV